MRLYIASKYCPKDCTLHDAPRVANKNVETAIRVAIYLIKLGHQPYVPILNHYIQINVTAKDFGQDYWYAYDLEFIRRWAEGIVVVGEPDESKGMQLELAEASKLGLPMYKFDWRKNVLRKY